MKAETINEKSYNFLRFQLKKKFQDLLDFCDESDVISSNMDAILVKNAKTIHSYKIIHELTDIESILNTENKLKAF